MIPGNFDTEKQLEDLPDRVADALQAWRIASLEREKLEALLYMRFKGSGEKRTSDEIKAMVRSDALRYEASLKEIGAEVNYNRLYERLMSVKKVASLRTAF